MEGYLYPSINSGRWSSEGLELPVLCTKTSGQGPELPMHTPELPVGRISPGRISAQNLRDPSREETPKLLSQNSTGKLLGPELPGHRKFPGGTSGEKFRDPSREGSQKDLVDFALGPELPPVGRNFRPPGNSAQRAGTSGPERTRNPFLQDSLLRL